MKGVLWQGSQTNFATSGLLSWSARASLDEALGTPQFFPSLEAEVRAINRAVVQFHYQLSTGASPGWIGLPDVDVAVRRRIVTKTAAARRNRFRQITRRVARVARHRS